MVYNREMLEFRETTVFSDWLAALRDAEARTRVQARILRLRHGNFGDVKPGGRASLNCELILAPAIVCIACSAARSW